MPSPDQVEADGTTLFYKRRGSGPVLLVIQGGAADADGSHALAAQLEDDFTVVSYDRRGLSRSPVLPGHETCTIGDHGDDALLLLRSITNEPAYVFGVSIGGLIGLDMLARAPELTRRAVIHEAPTTRFPARRTSRPGRTGAGGHRTHLSA